MIEYNKIFLDTTPLIYFLDDDINFGQKTETIFEKILSNNKTIVTSVITCTEYLIYPYRTNNYDKINIFFEFAENCNINFIPISMEIAKTAAKIRAEYKGFKTMDSLQLAFELNANCDIFLTNDKQLKQFKSYRMYYC